MVVYHAEYFVTTVSPTHAIPSYLVWTSVRNVGVSLALRLCPRRSLWNQGHQKTLRMWTLRSYFQLLRDQYCQGKVQNSQQHLHGVQTFAALHCPQIEV